MNKILTKQDIMDLICVTSAQFEWCIKSIRVIADKEFERKCFYSVQDLIDIYNFVHRRKKCMVFQSKTNSYE